MGKVERCQEKYNNESVDIKPTVYTEDSKTAEDYGEFVKLIGILPTYTMESVFYTKPEEDCVCYIPPVPFLGKYPQLYYKQDDIAEDLLGCFVDW
jgi:hypothetical protein